MSNWGVVGVAKEIFAGDGSWRDRSHKQAAPRAAIQSSQLKIGGPILASPANKEATATSPRCASGCAGLTHPLGTFITAALFFLTTLTFPHRAPLPRLAYQPVPPGQEWTPGPEDHNTLSHPDPVSSALLTLRQASFSPPRTPSLSLSLLLILFSSLLTVV